KRPLQTSLKVSGILAIPPQYKAEVSTFISGNVKNIKVREGNHVNKGQTLAILQHPNYIELQQNFQKAASSLTYLKEEFERKQTLFDKEVGSAKDFQKAKADYQTAQSRYRGLNEKLQLLRLDPQQIKTGKIFSSIALRAPISGYVTSIHVSTGQYVTPQEGLIEISNNDQIFADFKVYEQDLDKVKEGMTIHFEMANRSNHTIEAKVTSIGKQLDQNHRAVHIHADIITPSSNILPGMYVNGRLVSDSLKVPTLPHAAIISEGTQSFIFIADVNSETQTDSATVFKMVEIATGTSNERFTEVKLLTNLPQGTPVVTQGAYYLKADMTKEQNSHSH
ncbi:MAG TPA: efflux RND transporter periplasmic adaptor subunit, partial [Chitinophagaceae bacterium]|nr:efflux RND transporter periplasmic adaptor subunit [Chitinophagaceae bacterium]